MRIGTVEFDLQLPGGPRATLERSVLSGASRLRIHGTDLERSGEPGRPFLVPDGGGTRRLYVEGRGYDYVPRVTLEGKDIQIARPLARWEYALAATPLLLVIPGLYIGAVGGFLGMALDQWILRRPEPLPKRVIGTLLVLVIGFGAVVLILDVSRAVIAAGGGELAVMVAILAILYRAEVRRRWDALERWLLRQVHRPGRP